MSQNNEDLRYKGRGTSKRRKYGGEKNLSVYGHYI